MISHKYIFADRVVEVNAFYDDVHEYCADYRTDAPADFCVTVSQQDIDFEREKSAREDIAAGRNARQYPDSYLEELAVYRKIAEQMIEYDTILFHGSVVAVDGAGYLFTAKSGTGKSTHTKLWREYLGDRAVMVNDDKPLLRITDSGVIVCGTPYNGKHRIGSRISVPLKAICILNRSAENHIVSVSGAQAYPMLLQQVYRPSDSEKMQKTLKLIDMLISRVSLYRLGCNMDISAAETAYQAMKGF